MKILYTILFFADTLALILLSFLFLKLLDTGIEKSVLVLVISAIVFCIILLVYFLLRYIKQPPSNSRN
ncbi:MAG: hypothetical protein ABI687_03670 [Flavitalea sp.]